MVENFSYYECGTCETKHDLFGKSGDARKVAKKFGIENVVQLPIDPELKSDKSKELFIHLADVVVREISKIKYNAVLTTFEQGVEGFKLAETTPQGEVVFEKLIPFRTLRLNCKSATMIDEWTGEKLFKEENIPQDVHPKKVEKAGNYAYRIDWSDGHHSIFPVKAIKELQL